MFGNKEGVQLFKAHFILDRKEVQIQDTFVGNNWFNEEEEQQQAFV